MFATPCIITRVDALLIVLSFPSDVYIHGVPFGIVFRSLHVAIVTSRVSRDNAPADGNRAHRRRSNRHFYICTRTTDRVRACIRLWDTCCSLLKKKKKNDNDRPRLKDKGIDVAKDSILLCDDRMTVDYDIVLQMKWKRERGKRKIRAGARFFHRF